MWSYIILLENVVRQYYIYYIVLLRETLQMFMEKWNYVS